MTCFFLFPQNPPYPQAGSTRSDARYSTLAIRKPSAKTKSSAHVHALSFFGGRGWMSRAALMIRNPGCGSQRLLLCRSHPAGRGPSLASLFPPQAAVGSAAVRIHPRGCDLRCRAKTKNQRIFYAGFFGGRGWIRTTEAEKQQIYSLSPLATREHAQIHFLHGHR